MTRNLERLSRGPFDVLVIGGGIYGLAIAYDASLRGLETALIDRGDFGGGSSFNHLRTIHGGLRYLQTLDVARARESIRERRTFARIAPHAVVPLAFVLPLDASLTRGPLAMQAGFLLDRIVAFDRNDGVPASHRLPPGRVTRAPAAAVWYDYITVEADRLTFSFALAAAQHGAAIANYVSARDMLVSERRVRGARVTAVDAGSTFDVQARVVVNATGAAIDELLAPLGAPSGTSLLKAMNLVTTRLGSDRALGGRTRSGRTLFQVPWRGRALFGTWESPHAVRPEAAAAVDPSEVRAFIGEINEAFPDAHLTPEDVSLVHRGVVPARRVDGGVALEGHQIIHDHADAGIEGLLSVAGTKYTTARAVAEQVVDLAVAKLSRGSLPSRTAAVPLPGGDVDVDRANIEAATAYAGRLAPETIRHLVAAYGSAYRAVGDLCVSREEWRRTLSSESPVVAGQLVWAARHELVVTLADALVRRTPLGALGRPADHVVEQAAAIVGAECGWSSDRIRQEIENVDAVYGTLKASKT